MEVKLKRARQFDRAFTLIEVLIGIGVLLILLALLTPGLQGGRRSALVSELTQRLRQIDTAHRLYLHDHEEIYLAHRPVTNSLRQMNVQALASHPQDKSAVGTARTYYQDFGVSERLGEMQHMLDLLPHQTLFLNLTMQTIERGESMQINKQEVTGVSAAVPYALFLISKDGALTAPARVDDWIEFLSNAQSVRVWTNGRIDTIRHPGRPSSLEFAFLHDVVTPNPLPERE